MNHGTVINYSRYSNRIFTLIFFKYIMVESYNGCICIQYKLLLFTMVDQGDIFGYIRT